MCEGSFFESSPCFFEKILTEGATHGKINVPRKNMDSEVVASYDLFASLKGASSNEKSQKLF
jgi:hypothetical protein